MTILNDGADYVRIEVRAGNRTRTVEMHASAGQKIKLELDVDVDTMDAPTGPAGMIETHPTQKRVRLVASGPAGEPARS